MMAYRHSAEAHKAAQRTWSTEWDMAPALVAAPAMTLPLRSRLPFFRANSWYRQWWGWSTASRSSSLDRELCMQKETTGRC